MRACDRVSRPAGLWSPYSLTRSFFRPLALSSDLPGWLAGWVCVPRVIMKKRWSSPGSRCDIPQAPGHPRVLLPLCVLPNSPASGLASSHSGVARNDSHRTVSFHSPFPWISSSSLALVETPLFPSPFSLPPSISLTFTLSSYYTTTARCAHTCTRRIRDRIAEQIRVKLGLSKEQLTLAQVLESATWKGGREIAKEKRLESGGGPPIEIVSDGTVF